MHSLPLPDDPTLATCATVLNELGHSSHVLDARWRIVFLTDELRRTIGDAGGDTIARLGQHLFGSSEVAVRKAFFFDDWLEGLRENFRRLGPSQLDGGAGTGGVDDRPASVDRMWVLPLRSHRRPYRLELSAVRSAAQGAAERGSGHGPRRTGDVLVHRRTVRPGPCRTGGAARPEGAPSLRSVRNEHRG